MPRPRTNDPSNLPMAPNLASDPERLNELVKEFQNRLAFLTESYAVSQQSFESGDTFNESLERLRRGLNRKRILKRKGVRLHPEIEFLLSHQARRLAKLDGVTVNESHIRAAGQHVVDTVKSRMGRPENPMLMLHIEGLMAVVQEFSGKPVLCYRHKDSVYGPGFAQGLSQIIPNTVKLWDKDITLTQLVNIVQKIRKKYAGKPLAFRDLFPFYGSRVKDMKIVPPSGVSIEEQNLNIPTYCP